MARVVVFDLGALGPLFTDLFGEPSARQAWFEQGLQTRRKPGT
ncbi:hypothetical protein [Deinococcus metallilatus]|uniref:Uncharacterized protein n=1 Tax=Deinococcus metallilatus TaxID=1211322 RepID=A0ABR6MRS6_9DEIO|nr:hypothetical protein [Deinococcus metallilatus]MBB5294604.1 hypothetical protein [Deinococcus metallilatus]